jgi:septal ring factor EnvC (AmiA/AmiB activator)
MLPAEVQCGTEMIPVLQEDKEELQRQSDWLAENKDLIATSKELKRRTLELEAMLEAEKITFAKFEAEVTSLKGEKSALSADLEERAKELTIIQCEHAALFKQLQEVSENGRCTSVALEERLAISTKETNELKILLERASQENKLMQQELLNLQVVNDAKQRNLDLCISEQTTRGDWMSTRIRELEEISEKAGYDVAHQSEKVQRLNADRVELRAALAAAEAGAAEVKERAVKAEVELEMKTAQMRELNQCKEQMERRYCVRDTVLVCVCELEHL